MKVTFIGTGTMGSTTRNNTSVLVDDILFDIGSGIVKQLDRLKVYTEAVKYLVITHFHADHFLDIPNLIFARLIRKEIDKFKLVIIGPVGLRKKVIDLLNFTHSDGNEHKYDKADEKYNLEFIELDNNQQYCTDSFKITALTLKHGNCIPMNGYVLEKDGKTISYACDTSFCENFDKMCRESDYIFGDATGLKTTVMHMGLEDFKQLHSKYSNCIFYAVHRSDYDTNGIDDVEFPNDGDILEI